jgi:uncharacterized protein (TIGR00266 family)
VKVDILGKPAFGHLKLSLEPGESIVAEAGAMASMHAKMDMKAKLNGGFFKGLIRKVLGGESLFINFFTNNSNQSQGLVLTQNTPGDMLEYELQNEKLFLQPGAYIASESKVKLSVKWAGIHSFIAREGLFKLQVEGEGKVWIGAFGAILPREVEGSLILDTAHLVAYSPSLKLKTKLSGGLISSLASGEGLVTSVEGEGKIWIQSRSLSGLVGWINPRLIG